MQTHTRILPIACLWVLAPLTASAEGWYIEGNAGIDRPDELEFFGADEFYIPTIGARTGYQLTKNWSIEGDLRIGIQDDSADLGFVGGEADLGLTYSAGLFARASAPLSERLSAHLRIGAFTSEYDIELIDVSGTTETNQFTSKPDGLAFGAGAEYDLSEDLYLRTDYTIYELPGEDSGSLSVGMGLKF